MKLAIMQPYFFPYIGYFQLMSIVDHWVVFDDIQFIDKGWVNRNRILHPDIKKEWQYITVPLSKRRQFDKICDIEINARVNWRDQIMGKLTSYKRKAPHYNQTVDFLGDCFETSETNLSRFLVTLLKKSADLLEIDTKLTVQSEMGLELGEIEHPGQWALRICEKMNASEYINPYGGAGLFEEQEYEDVGIKIRFHRPLLREYSQRRDGFVPGLSLIDVLMWNSISEIRDNLLNEYQIARKEDLTDE